MPDAIRATIRCAVSADATSLADLARRMFNDTFGAHNRASDMDVYTSRAFSPALQRAQIESPHIRTLLVQHDTELIGYAQLRCGAVPDCVASVTAIELWRFYIDRAWLGRGIAQQLMHAAQKHARTFDVAAIWLGVWEHNPRAIAFYRKFGFRQVGAHDFMLGSDRQTDLILLSDDL